MRRSMWGIRKERTITKHQSDQVPKVVQHLNSSVSTVMSGLMGMNGTIRSLRRGILLLNIRLTFYVVRNALWRFLINIKKNMLGHE